MSKVGICKICGKEFIKVGQEQICSDECRKESYKETKLRYYRSLHPKKEAKDRKKKSNLNEKVAEASRRGISYGQLVAEEQMAQSRITFEE